MAIVIFLALCAAGAGFLLFVLVHFVRDEKNGRTNGPAARQGVRSENNDPNQVWFQVIDSGNKERFP